MLPPPSEIVPDDAVRVVEPKHGLANETGTGVDGLPVGAKLYVGLGVALANCCGDGVLPVAVGDPVTALVGAAVAPPTVNEPVKPDCCTEASEVNAMYIELEVAVSALGTNEPVKIRSNGAALESPAYTLMKS